MREFLKAIRAGEHRVSPMTWAAGIGAIVYTFVPLDLIPEILLGPLGLADDLGVWGIFAALIAREHKRWQAGLESP